MRAPSSTRAGGNNGYALVKLDARHAAKTQTILRVVCDEDAPSPAVVAYGACTDSEFTRKFQLARQGLSSFPLTRRNAIGQCIAQLLPQPQCAIFIPLCQRGWRRKVALMGYWSAAPSFGCYESQHLVPKSTDGSAVALKLRCSSCRIITAAGNSWLIGLPNFERLRSLLTEPIATERATHAPSDSHGLQR
jgi:hypothetical protein